LSSSGVEGRVAGDELGQVTVVLDHATVAGELARVDIAPVALDFRPGSG
jgi:hypothetical protein